MEPLVGGWHYRQVARLEVDLICREMYMVPESDPGPQSNTMELKVSFSLTGSKSCSGRLGNTRKSNGGRRSNPSVGGGAVEMPS